MILIFLLEKQLFYRVTWHFWWAFLDLWLISSCLLAWVLTLWLNSKLWIYEAFIPFLLLNCTNVWHYIMFDHKIHFIIVKLLKKESMMIFLRFTLLIFYEFLMLSSTLTLISEFNPWSPISFDAVHSAFPSCIWGFTMTTDLVPAVKAVFSLVLCILLYECMVFTSRREFCISGEFWFLNLNLICFTKKLFFFPF